MTEQLIRLQRLHSIRRQLADCAAAERKRIAQQVRFAEQAMTEIQKVNASAFPSESGRDAQDWSERSAELQVAARQHAAWRVRLLDLASVEQVALQQERAAVQAREQMARMVERRQAEFSVEQARRDQGTLDDLFAMTRVRAAMATTF